jgi:S-adenosylmethionine:tRNA ribosyltransferase-isomerase
VLASELDYDLPPDLIAQHPSDRRDASRLLVLDRASEQIRADTFLNLPRYLRRGDCLVLNETKVIRARLFGHKPSGGRVEILLLRETAPGAWEALVKPSAKVKPDTIVSLSGGGVCATIGEILPEGRRAVRFDTSRVLEILEKTGEIPLPPYIRRAHAETLDMDRYQTIYARTPGAVAAPTAGLHFTPEVFTALDEAGIERAALTLHVGYGTFRPIRAERVEEHKLDPEEFELPQSCADRLNETRARGGRVIAVGTTVARVLETQFREGRYHPGHGVTAHYIYPPYGFHALDALQTNFHLPRSSLLALVYAFGGIEFMRRAYRFAIEQCFRFYSYGDVTLIL